VLHDALLVNDEEAAQGDAVGGQHAVGIAACVGGWVGGLEER
jgi:hypothetical protein